MAIIFTEGFDKYHTPGDITKGEWSNIASIITGQDMQMVDGLLDGQGRALEIFPPNGSGGNTNITKNLTANYTTLVFGARIKWRYGRTYDEHGISFRDADTAQMSVAVNGLGQIIVRRGEVGTGTLLTTYAAAWSSLTTHYLEVKITFDGAAGAYTVNLDNVQVINVSGVDTIATANAYANAIAMFAQGTSAGNDPGTSTWDDLYLLDTTGSAPLNDILGSPRVETVFPNSDVQRQFDMITRYMGRPFYDVFDVGTVSVASNRIYLQKYAAPASGSVSTIGLNPGQSSVTARFKGVMYADNGSGTAPAGAPIGNGTEVVGCTSAVHLTLPLATTATVVKDTNYWVGYIGDTTLNQLGTDDQNTAIIGTITYPTIPATASSVTYTSGATGLFVWADITSATTNYTEVNIDPIVPVNYSADYEDNGLSTNELIGDLSYVSSTTVGDTDLYGHGGLVTDPVTIYSVCLKAAVKNSDAGARTVDLVMLTGTATSAGTASGITPSNSYEYIESFFNTVPGATTVWTASELAASSFGIKIAS